MSVDTRDYYTVKSQQPWTSGWLARVSSFLPRKNAPEADSHQVSDPLSLKRTVTQTRSLSDCLSVWLSFVCHVSIGFLKMKRNKSPNDLWIVSTVKYNDALTHQRQWENSTFTWRDRQLHHKRRSLWVTWTLLRGQMSRLRRYRRHLVAEKHSSKYCTTVGAELWAVSTDYSKGASEWKKKGRRSRNQIGRVSQGSVWSVGRTKSTSC